MTGAIEPARPPATAGGAPPFDAPWPALAALPRELWLPAVIDSVGMPAPRLAHIARWREALVAGELPPPDADFGDATAVLPLREAIGTLGLPALARAKPALADHVLRTALWHLDRIIDRAVGEPRAAAIARAAAGFADEWRLEKGDVEAVLALLPELADTGLRWDRLRGLLRAREWQQAGELVALLARRPELTALIDRIGRSEHAPAAPMAATPPLDGRDRRSGQRAIVTRLPDAPGALRGIRYSDRIERMLGSELQQLRHPVLHKLWRARRAEARLLAYDSEALLVDWRADPHAPPREHAAAPQREPLQRGPMIVALDTSGSMQGAPERIAKAVVLQVLRTAHAQRRGCRLIAFGGSGELLQRDLDFTPQGLAALLELLGQSFDGGTDVQAPIEAAIDAVHGAQWRSADLLIVSDGEFGCTPATLALLDEAREGHGLRVLGLLIGDRETLGLMEVADEIHWLRDWRRDDPRGHAPAGFSPVHSKSLTALYFPQALGERASRHRA